MIRILAKPQDTVVAFERGDRISLEIFGAKYQEVEIEDITRDSVTLKMADGSSEAYAHTDLRLRYEEPAPSSGSPTNPAPDRYDDMLLFHVNAGTSFPCTDGKSLEFRSYSINPREAVWVPPVYGPPSPILSPAQVAQLQEESAHPFKPPLEWLLHPQGFLAPNGVFYTMNHLYYYYPEHPFNNKPE